MIFKEALPTSPEELVPYIGRMQKAMNDAGTVSEQRMAEVTAELKAAHENVQKHEAERKVLEDRVANAEALAKAATESNRGVSGDVESQLRSLPKVHKVNRDEDYRGKVAPDHFNVLALSRSELELYLSGDALAWAKRFRRLNDMTQTAHLFSSIIASGDPQRAAEYHGRGGIKGQETWGALQECWKQGGRALDTATSGGISEWIPTVYSADKFDDTRDRMAFGSRLRWLPMPQSPWTIPTLLTFMTAYLIPESGADDNSGDTAFVASDPGVSNKTLTARKLATITRFSRESDQESIVPLIPMIDFEINYAHAYAAENMVVNGQRTSSIDTAPAATDARKAADGVRYAAKLVGGAVDFAAGMTAELLVSMIGKAGKYAELDQCEFLTGYAGLARALILKDAGGNLLYMTRDRAGENATLFAGTVGVLMGYPLTISGVYPQNMSATGSVDGAGGSTKTGILFVNKRPFLGGYRQGIQVEQSIHEKFAYDQVSIRSTQRLAFTSLLTASSTRPFVIEGVNLATF